MRYKEQTRSKPTDKKRKDGRLQYSPAHRFEVRLVKTAWEDINQKVSQTSLSRNSVISLCIDLYLMQLPDRKVKQIVVEYDDGTVALHDGDNDKTVSNFKK